MAICPHCHSQDKNFFADKCHNCNTSVSMGDQFASSFIYNLFAYGTIILVLVLLFG